MNRLMLLVTGLLLTLTTMLSATESIYLLPLKITGIDAESKDVIKSLLEEELIAKGAQVIVAQDSCKTIDCALTNAKNSGFTSIISGSVRKLGEKITFYVQVTDVQTSATTATHRLSASSIEESDVIISRLAKSILNKESVDEAAEVGMIAEGENKNEVTRKESFFSNGMYLGTNTIVKDDMAAAMTLGTKTWYETPDYAGELTIDFSYATEATGFGLGLGFVKFLSRDDMSPFVSLGLGYSFYTILNEIDPTTAAVNDYLLEIAKTEDSYYFEDNSDYDGNFDDGRLVYDVDSDKAYFRDRFAGLAPKIGIGMAFLRTYDFKFVLEGEYELNIPMFAEQGDLNSVYHTFGINIAIMKKKSKRRSLCCF